MATKDVRNYPFQMTPAGKVVAITAAPTDLASIMKSLRVFVPSATLDASVTYITADAGDGEAVTVKFPPGLYLELAVVRRVTAINGAGVEVHGYTEV